MSRKSFATLTMYAMITTLLVIWVLLVDILEVLK